MATIHVIQGPDKGRTFDLAMAEAVLGRQSGDLQLNDPTVSRQHARLMPSNGLWMIEDMGAANGTYLNGVRLRRAPQRLSQGDQIRIGATLLVFGGPGPRPPTSGLDMDETGHLVDSAIMASIPSNEDSIVVPTPEAGALAITNLRQLYHIISTISTIFNVDLLLNRVLDHVFELLNPDRAYVLMIDETGEMMPKAARHRDGDDERIPISRTIVDHVVKAQVGVLCSNAMSDRRFTSGESVHAFGMRSVLCVPIQGRDRIIGVLHVDSSVANTSYSTEQLRLLTAIGYQTGLAVENVQLYEAAVQSARLAAVGETVASLSHHIKNILQALIAGADVVDMAMGKDQPDKAKKAWPLVTRNLERLNREILNMLAFSKPRQPLLEYTNLDAVIMECLELLTPQADEKGVAVLKDLGDLPPVPVDPEGLHQALLNILANALEAVPAQTGAITISTRFDNENQEAVVMISDNGKGIDNAAKARLFEPFFSTKGQKGTGLGLAVANKVVREHDGAINVVSQVGHGSTFTVRLPANPKRAMTSDQTHGPA